MPDVIAAKPHRGRKAIGKIGENCIQFVQQIIFEHAIMNGVVDDDEIGVIGEGANANGDKQR